MRTTGFLILLYLFLAQLGTAQQTGALELGARPLGLLPIRVYQSGGFPASTPTHFRTDLDQTWQKVGYFGGRLKKQLEPNTLALEHLRRYKSATWINTICTFGAASTGVAAIVYTLPYLGAVFGIAAEPGPRLTQRPIFWLGACGLLTIGGIISRGKATQELQGAVLTYNEGLTAVPRPAPIHLRLRPAGSPTGAIGLGLSIQY